MPETPARTRAVQWLTQVGRFGLVGVVGAAPDYLALRLAVAHGVSPYVARPFTLIIAIIVTWWLNRSLTFAARTPPTWREFGHYAAITSAGLAIQLVVYWIALYLGAPIWLAFITGIACSVTFSFLRVRRLFSRG